MVAEYTHGEILENAVRVLNEALRADYGAVFDLVHVEVGCNMALADHPTVQVGCVYNDDGEVIGHRLRPLGLINGLFGVDAQSQGYIYMIVDKNTGRIMKFSTDPNDTGE